MRPDAEGHMLKYLYIWGGIAVLIVIVAFVWRDVSKQPAPSASSAAQQAREALAQTQAVATSSIPATSNPVKDATPAVNPVGTANPFTSTSNTSASANARAGASTNNDYQNPFQ